MAKIYTSYFTSDEVELKFDTEYRFIENEKNNKENDEEIICFSSEYNSELISKSKNKNSHIKLKRFALRNALLLGSFWLGFLMPCACSRKEKTEIVVESEESVNVENTTEDVTTVVEENTEPEVTVEWEVKVEPEISEPVEEINPRDMKAVYGLDFEVPIYTEEEVEQAKYNLQHNYSEYNNYEDFSDEQMLAINNDYYVANQDFWYQLYNMTKDFKAKTAYIDGKKTYYLEDKDWYIKVENGYIRIYGQNFLFVGASSNNSYDIPNQNLRFGMLSIGPGSYTLCSPQSFYDLAREDIKYEIGNSNPKDDLKELEHYGFHNNDLTVDFVSYNNDMSLTLE